MNACIVLTEQNKSEELVSLLESERNNIMAHPNNTVERKINILKLYEVIFLLLLRRSVSPISMRDGLVQTSLSVRFLAVKSRYFKLSA